MPTTVPVKGIAVVVADKIGADAKVGFYEARNGDHLVVLVADVHLAEGFGALAELGLGLELDAPDAAELVEVIDIERAEVGLPSPLLLQKAARKAALLPACAWRKRR